MDSHGSSRERVPLVRPRLLKRLGGGWKVAVLSAPAGYGKTTLAAQFVAGRRAVWCRISTDDRNPAHLLGSLLAATARARPPFGSRTHALFTSRRDMERDGATLTASFLDELAPDRGERFVVLDDLHLIAEGAHSLAWLRRVIEDAGPRVRVLIACRGPCPLPLARFDLTGGSVVLSADELSFTPQEQARVLGAGARLDAPGSSRLREWIRGWPAGLALAAQHLRRTGHVPAPPGGKADDADSRGGRLFDFLAEEVFLPLPATLQRALCRAALLEDLEPAGLARALGSASARALQSETGRRDLFVQVPPDGAAPRFHPLFHEFLRTRAREILGETETHRTLSRLAAHWQARGEPVHAIRALAAAGEREAAVRLFEKTAASRGARAAEQPLGSLALELSSRSVSAARSPWIVLHGAYHAADSRDHARAIRLAREAEDAFVERGVFGPAARAFRCEATSAILTARVRTSITRGAALLRRIPTRERLARAMTELAVGELWIHAGESGRALAGLAAAARLLGGSRQPIERAEVAMREATVRFIEGRWDIYLDIAQRVLPVFRRAGYERRVLALLINMAEACNYLGEEDHAVAYLDEARALGLREGNETLAMLEAECRARAASEKGDFPLAARLFREARAVARASGVEVAPLKLDVWEGIFERRRTRLSRAAAMLARALEGFSRFDLPSWIVLARMERALVTGLEGQASAALAELATAARESRRLGDTKELARNALFEARVRLAAGGDFRTPLERALRSLQRENYLVLLRKEADVAVPLLAAALASEATQALARGILPALPESTRSAVLRASGTGGRRARESFAARGTDPARAPIGIRLLGGFEVRIGDRSAIFARRAAEALVAHLAMHRERPVHRERLAETLWPGAPPQASRNRFDVTLNAARRALEPDIGPRGPFRILIAEGGLCRLGAVPTTVDVEEFERLAQECEPLLALLARAPWLPGPALGRADARHAREALERAVVAYGGELLPRIRDVEWVETARSRLAARHRRLVRGLGTAALLLGNDEQAAACAERVLAEDPLEEESLRLAMRAYAARGGATRALAAYRAFAARLERELDASPSPETVALAEELEGPKPRR